MGHLSGLSCRAHLDERLLGNRRKSFVNMGPLPGVAFAWLVVWGLVFSAGKVTGERGLLQSKVKVDGAKSAARVFKELESGQVVELDFEKLQVMETLVIEVEDIVVRGPPDGAKPVITCPPNAPAMRISASQVTIENVIFEDCRLETGAAVAVQPGADLDFSDTEVLIFSILLSGVEFRNIEATDFFFGEGGLTINQASVSIQDSVFLKNTGASGAAVSVKSGWLSVENCNFTKNIARSFGGAISFEGQGSSNQTEYDVPTKGLSINECKFDGNVAQAANVGTEIYDEDGSPLEPLIYYKFPVAAGQGGAIKIKDVTNVAISSCTFVGNQAPSGGAISIELETTTVLTDLQRILISTCTFQKNTAVFPEPSSDDFAPEQDDNLLSGGAIFAIVVPSSVEFSILDSTFSENTAQFGGGLHIVTSESGKMKISGCAFERNTAGEFGGAGVFRNLGGLSWSSSNVKQCTAKLGGGIFLTNNAGMLMLGPDPSREKNEHVNSLFEGNMAVDGGGMMCAMCGATTLQGPWFFRNKASRNGGGLSVIDAVTELNVQEGKFNDNIAMRGGGAFVDTASHLKLFTNPAYPETAPTRFRKNRAVSGGALMIIPRNLQRNKIEIISVIFDKNEALKMEDVLPELEDIRGTLKGSRNLLQDEARKEPTTTVAEEVSADCGSAGGGGICLLLDRIPESSTVDVFISNSKFTRNRAGIGGAIYASIGRELDWKTKRCRGSFEPTSVACRSFQLREPSFAGNLAVYGGGALFVSDPTRVSIAECSIWGSELPLHEVWKQGLLEDFCLQFESNQVQDGEFGNDMATRAFSLQITPSPIKLMNQTSGQPLDRIVLRVVDAFNQTVTGGLPDAEIDVGLQSSGVTGQLLYKASKGVIDVNNSQAIGDHTEHNIAFSADGLESANAKFTIRDCYPGELQGKPFQACIRCNVNQYSFHPEAGCLPCEKEAQCRGGAALVPNPGWWHSTPYSPDFHECIIHEACDYTNRIENLTVFYSDPAALVLNNNSNEDYKQCSQGYKGILCGSCEEGYGHFSGGECKKCQSSSITTWIVALVAIWSALLVSFEIINSVSANRDFLKGVNASFLNTHPVGSLPQESTTGPVQIEMHPISRYGTGNSVASSATNQPIGAEIFIPDDVEAAENLTETVKIFTNYLQVTSLAVTINLSWEKFVRRLLQAKEILAGISSGSTVVPLDCTFDQNPSTPRSILALWLRILFPIFLLVFFLVLVVVAWCVAHLRRHLRAPEGRRAHSDKNNDALQNLSPHNLTTYFIIVTIAVAFFAYNGVTEELMRTINCLKLDYTTATQPANPYRLYTFLPEGQVWAEDTSLICFKGQHTVTGVFGVLFLLLFSLGFIVFIFVLLLRNKQRALKQDVQFLARYGFLYRAYKTDSFTIYWEAIVTLRKALIGAVVVYAYPLGPNLQAVLALGVLIVALLLHLVAQPYKEIRTKICGGILGTIHEEGPDLNQLETLSLLMSLLTFYSGVVFNDKNTSDSGKLVMTVVISFLHITFVLYMVIFRVWGGLHVAVHEKIKVLIADTNEVYKENQYFPSIIYLLKVWFGAATKKRSGGTKNVSAESP